MSDEYDFAIVRGTVLTADGEAAPLSKVPAAEAHPAADEQAARAEAPADDGVGAAAEPVAAGKPKGMSKKRFEKELQALRGDWRALEEAVARSGRKLVILVEGRDTGRERGIVSRIAEFADGRVSRIARVEAPGTRERSQWFFQPYVAHLPASGELAIFDGGWYARAALDRATGTFSEGEYADLLRACRDFEHVLVQSGVVVKKYWLSVEGEQNEFLDQLMTIAKRWKIGTKTFGDLDYAAMREQILASTAIVEMPWTVISSPDRREMRLGFVRRLVDEFVQRDPAADTASPATLEDVSNEEPGSVTP